MDIPSLDLELIRQHPDSDDCLRACALMTLKYFNHPIKKETLWKKLHVYKKHSGLRGAYLQDFGRLAIFLGFSAKIYHYDWGWWDGETIQEIKNGKKSLIAALKRLRLKKENWSDKRNIDKDIEFVKAGGEFEFSIPKLDIIDTHLISRIPVILLVEGQFFYHQPQMKFRHSIVVVGKKSENYLIKDPLFAFDSINKDELFYSWSNAQGWMLTIFPSGQKVSLLVKQPKLRF